MRKFTITPNWTDLVKCSSQRGAPENIDPKDTWFNTDYYEDPRKNPIHETIFDPYIKIKTMTLSLSETHGHEDFYLVREHPHLNFTNAQSPREFKIHQNKKNVLLKNNPT